MRLALVLPFCIFCASVDARPFASEEAELSASDVPVYSGDLDRPYRVIGEIKDNLRKHFAFQANPTEQKIYAELWERGRKLGADAVIHARYGPTKGTMFNHGRTPISGTAIKFTDSKAGAAQ